MRFTRNDVSDQIIVAIDVNFQKILFINLISFELISFIVELTTHFLHMMQLQNSRQTNSFTMLVNDFFCRTYINMNDNRFQN